MPDVASRRAGTFLVTLRGCDTRAESWAHRVERFFPGGRSRRRRGGSHENRNSLYPGNTDAAATAFTFRQKPAVQSRAGVKPVKTSTFMRNLIAILALEWELGSQDPVIFCYRIGVQPARVFLGRFSKRRH